MKNLKSHFRFNRQERSGIFFLLLTIVSLQTGYYFFIQFTEEASDTTLIIDSQRQAQIDVLKKTALKKDSVKIFPFNPNFITDYKGYVLGMSTEEIDRLHRFRKQDRFANTPEEFQRVTQISDSLLTAISPYFKFPEWTQTKGNLASGSNRPNLQQRSYSEEGGKQETQNNSSFSIEGSGSHKFKYGDSKPGLARRRNAVAVTDLNKTTAEELRSVYGIGAKLSARIIKFRDRLGGFLVDEQLYDVYGLEPEVVARVLQRFKVLDKPSIQKINVNEASVEQLSKLVYIKESMAYRIVDYRERNGGIRSLDELRNIEDFPSERIPRIALYLSL